MATKFIRFTTEYTTDIDGSNKSDPEEQANLWLEENPGVKIVRWGLTQTTPIEDGRDENGRVKVLPREILLIELEVHGNDD